MRTFKFGTAVAGALLVLGVTSAGCVADRPARNGVFNENQYIRKDFLIQGVDINGTAQGTDPGWMMRATVTETSTPNLGGSAISIIGGLMADVQLVRFRVTQDKLDMLSMIQLSNPIDTAENNGTAVSNTDSTTESVVNAWPATNVDLKYRVNLDGETTNFYEENQELDWEVRQWIKLQFDKNDFSDIAPLGIETNDLINKCADVVNASATLVTGSFNMEGAETDTLADDYFEFTVQVAIPMMFDDQTCLQAYGSTLSTAMDVNRTTITANLKYSFKRATPVTYQPWIIGEKDPIRTKYGPFLYTAYDRDNSTDLLAANQYIGRFDPTKPIVWYFDANFPENYKSIFRNTSDPGDLTTIQGATNALLKQASAVNPSTTAQVSFLDYDSGGVMRNYGDIRYNFLRWVSDQDIQASGEGFAGITMPGYDPRSGEIINEGIEFNDYAVLSEYVYRIDAFLTTVGASSGLGSMFTTLPAGQSASCTVGQTLPLITADVLSIRNASDTLYTKMQQYLNLNGTDPNNNHLGPADFAAVSNETDVDFLSAYNALASYELFADPAMNPFVTPEGQSGVFGPAAVWQDLTQEATFQQSAATMNAGQTPYTQADGVGGVANAVGFVNQMRSATDNHMQLQQVLNFNHPNMHMDAPGSFSFETVMEQDSRQCVCGPNTKNCLVGTVPPPTSLPPGTAGVWETQDQWVDHIIDAYWQQVFWHEFGHAMGLEHNFMGSIDQPNFATQRDANGNVLCDNGPSVNGTCPNGHTLYNMYSSSIMEYTANPVRLAWTKGWGNYDKGAITWMYANNGVNTKSASAGKTAPATSRSGQVDATYPYNDPLGFCSAASATINTVAYNPDCNPNPSPMSFNPNAELRFLRCDENHLKYSPLCRQGDTGTTPSEIVANAIDTYEWKYQWRNFRNYRKVWDVSNYANEVVGIFTDMRRFLSQWYFDWNPANLESTFLRIGVVPPVGSDGQPVTGGSNGYSQVDYYSQLLQKFSTEMSATAQMMAAFDEAVIQQAAGERPYATVYDKFYGDETQQGIILDKYFAMQGFVGLWVSDNYDQNEAGSYLSSWGDFDFDSNPCGASPPNNDSPCTGASYQTVAETAVTSMIGTQYAAYPYFIPTAVALFAQDTHSPSFIGGPPGGGGSGSIRVEAKDWIGGWTFYSQFDLINFFKTIALNSCQNETATCLANCTNFETCTYDPTDPSQVSQSSVDGHFTGPDGLTYVYAYIPSRSEWVVARQDRNITTYKVIVNLNTDLIGNKDDGTDDAYGLEYPVKYTIDSYEAYEQGSLTADSQSSAGTSN